MTFNIEKLNTPFSKSTLWCVLLLAALGIVFFFPWLAGDSIFFPVHTGVYPPWRDELPPETLRTLDATATHIMSDKVFMFQPEIALSKERLLRGELPLWDPSILGGVPLMAQGLPALFHLPNMSYLFMAPEKAFAWTAFFQTLLAAVFMLLFLRSLGLRPFAATVGGFIFGFSGWMLIHLHYYQLTGAGMWLPLLLLGAEKILFSPRRGPWILVVAFAACQTLCAGFPHIAMINLNMVTLYGLVRAIQLFRKGGKGADERRVQRTDSNPEPGQTKIALTRLMLLAAGIVLGILLAGIQFFPSMALGFSPDNTREERSLEDLRQLTLDPACLAVYLAPDLFWSQDFEAARAPLNPGYAPLLNMVFLSQQAMLNYVEYHGYVGVLALILALLAFAARPRPGWLFFGVIAVFSLFIMLDVPGFIKLFTLVPGMGVGDPKRLLFLEASCLAVLAAFTLDAMADPGRGRRIRVAGLVLTGALILVVAGAWLSLSLVSDDTLKEGIAPIIHGKTGYPVEQIQAAIKDDDLALHRAHIGAELKRTLFYLVLAGVALVLNTTWTRTWFISRPLILAVLVLDLFTLGAAFNRKVPDLPLYDENNPVIAFLKERAGLDRILRVKENMILPVDSASLFGIHDSQGYTAFYFNRYRRLLDLVEPGRTQGYGIYCLEDEASLASPALDLTSVRYILSLQKLEAPGLGEVLHHKSVYIHENPDPLPRAFLHRKARWVKDADEAEGLIRAIDFDPRESVILEGNDPDAPDKAAGMASGQAATDTEGMAPARTTTDAEGMWPARISTYEEERVVIEVEGGPGWLVLNDVYAPGWKAALDGEPTPILPANLAFRAVEIPDAAPHCVEFFYEAPSVRLGKITTLSALLGFLGLAVFFAARSRRKQAMPRP